MADWVAAGREDDLAPGHVKVVQAGSLRLALCNVDGAFYCIDDVCTHDGGPLDQGELDDNEIECPRHGARFDVRTGRVTRLPAILPVNTYEVRVDSGEIQVKVP
ncbi:MAG: non-heme iron oxygenase ferredoxin subunit [Chloroflexi bacterium]|nr:non-heme iron oxygenase ferredoxin subunit [Chloroflexota bacterium]